MAPGVLGCNGGDLSAAAAITSLWSGGSGGGDAARDRMLPELPGRRGVLCRSAEALLGEAGGDRAFSTLAAAKLPELRWALRAIRSLSICSDETIVCVPSSDIVALEALTGEELRLP